MDRAQTQSSASSPRSAAESSIAPSPPHSPQSHQFNRLRADAQYSLSLPQLGSNVVFGPHGRPSLRLRQPWLSLKDIARPHAVLFRQPTVASEDTMRRRHRRATVGGEKAMKGFIFGLLAVSSLLGLRMRFA